MPNVYNSQKRSGREKATCLSILLFWWLRSIIKAGWKRDLTEEDVYPVLKTDHSATLGEKLEKNWINHLKNCGKKNRKPSFRWVLFRTYGKSFFFYGLFSFLEECVFRTIQVISLGWVIKSFEENQEATKTLSNTPLHVAGCGIVFGAFCYTTSFHWSVFNTHHVCTHMRLAVSSLIYRKTLRLSQATMRSFSIGQLITMLSSDVYRLDMQDLHFNYLWIAPAQLCVVIYLLYFYYEFKLPSLSGLGLLVVFVILQYIMGVYISKVRYNKIKATNIRMKLITEIMNAFYHIKIYAWENAYYARAKETRRDELNYVKKTMILRILNASLSLILTKMTVFLTLLFYIYYSEIKKLDAERVFITLVLYEHVRINFAHLFTRATLDLAEVSVTTKRMTEFLLLEEKYEDPTFYEVIDPELTYEVTGIRMENVSCKWHHQQENLTLEGIHLEITEGKMTVLVGPTASGKTSCLSAILGELPVIGGKLTVHGKVAYAPQYPWLFPGTIHQNIIFGKEFNEEWYNKVVEICGLKTDFANMEEGDRTSVARAGLSGGQKARISLARAVYSNCDIYILDEPLSCVDARLQRQIMERCIRGALKNKAVLFVTHQLHFLEDSDDILIILNGKIRTSGTYKELQSRGIQFTTEIKEEDEEDSDVLNDEESMIVDLTPRTVKKNSLIVIDEEMENDKLILTEKETFAMQSTKIDQTVNLGSTVEIDEIDADAEKLITPEKIGLKLFWKYLRASSSWILIIVLVILCLAVQVSYSLSEFYLEDWTKDEEELPQESEISKDQLKKRNRDIRGYCIVMACLVIFSILRSFVMFKICINASLTLFAQILSSLLHAKARFFETSCAGHGINRFSKDMIVIDEMLPTTLYEITGIILEILGAVGILGYTCVWTIIPSLVYLTLVVMLYKAYHNSAINLKRLEANARSPIFAHTAKTLEGLQIIRGFGQEHVFQNIFHGYQDNHTARWYLYLSLNAWLSMVVDLLSLLLISTVTMIFIFRDSKDVNPAEVGLAIVKVIEISILMQLAVSEMADVETEMISVERILEYSREATEEAWEKPENQPPAYWPLDGNIKFDNVSVVGHGYKRLLANVSVTIPAGEKIGIVGRSGAGKSTFINTLYRITEPSSGEIILDDIKIRQIGLHDLRRKISIIPQVPYVFAGTLRANLDPLREYSDHELWMVLHEVNLFQLVKTMTGGLDTEFHESGWEFSAGQAQLLGLARALLQKNQILCLDQATNNLDAETQQLIQKKINEKFGKCTVIAVAHRLQNVMNCNKIMVIESGHVVDYGDPYTLIKEKGPLCNLIMQLGKKNAEEIIKLAKDSELRRRASKRTQVSFGHIIAEESNININGRFRKLE